MSTELVLVGFVLAFAGGFLVGLALERRNGRH